MGGCSRAFYCTPPRLVAGLFCSSIASGADVIMSTSVVARGRMRRAIQKGEPIPSGWALDGKGQPTTNVADAYIGLILPLGGPKGSGLSLMMEFLGV